MKYVKEYMIEELGLLPLGEFTVEKVEEDTYMVRVEDKVAALEISMADYAMYMEKKYDALARS